MINDKLKLVLLLTFLGAIVLAGITGISASSDTNDTTTGTSNTINSISLNPHNTSEISSSNLLTSNSNNYNNNVDNENISTQQEYNTINDTTTYSPVNTNNKTLTETINNSEYNTINNTSTLNSDNTVSNITKEDANNVSKINDTLNTINSGNNTNTIIISGNFTQDFGKGGNFTVQLVDENGNPIVGQHIALNLTNPQNGLSKIYWVTTDVNGYAFLEINLAVGNYTASAYYYGNEYYNPSKGAVNTIKVTPKKENLKDPNLISGDITIIFGKGGNFTVQLVDEKGNPIVGQHIALNLTNTLNGLSKIYWVTTDINGYANLEINLVPGNYSVKSSYTGNTEYGSSEDKFNTIIVNNGAISNGTDNNTDTTNNITNGVSISDIISKANEVADFVNNNHRLPNYVTINGKEYTMAEFAYLLTSAISGINSGSTGNITPINVTQGNNASSSINGVLSLTELVNMAERIKAYIEANGVTPKFDSSNGIGTITFENYVYTFCKALAFYGENNRLPNTVTVQSSVFQTTTLPGSDTTTTNSGINDKNTISDTSGYLDATKNCEVNNAAIQALANKLTSGLTNDVDKALAIYNYVRDKISYSYYANSKYGAAGTLSKGYGNCVDQASLVIALCRASGIPARYVHGKNCKFSSGLVTGHVWAQILVDGVWYAADCTSTRNSLGSIVNWNTNSFTLSSISASISF